MNSDRQSTNVPFQGPKRHVLRFLRAAMRQLPVSFYLALAMICALILGIEGFRDFQDPKRLAFTLTLFVIFFGAVVYRAFIEALELARDYRKNRDGLLHNVFTRDQFSAKLGERVSEERVASRETDG